MSGPWQEAATAANRQARIEIGARMLLGAYLDGRPTTILTYDDEWTEAVIAEARKVIARLAPAVATPEALDQMEADWRREYLNPDWHLRTRGVASTGMVEDEREETP